MRSLAGRFPMHVVEAPAGTAVGFALIRPHHVADTLRCAAEATIFIMPEHIRQGMGDRLLALLEADAKANGVDTLLGCASSHNEQSISFQKKHGFVECGRFKRVGHKFNQDFDLVWLQKFL